MALSTRDIARLRHAQSNRRSEPQLDDLTAAQLERLYVSLDTLRDDLNSILQVEELRPLSAALDRAQRAVYAKLASPVQRLLDGDR